MNAPPFQISPPAGTVHAHAMQSPKLREPERAELDRQIAEYLNRGGQINEVGTDVNAYRGGLR